MGAWYEKYLGKRFAIHPDPPETFSCGELAFYVLKHECGIETPYVFFNRALLMDYYRDMQDMGKYHLEPLAEGEEPREFDVLYMARLKYYDHMGIAANTCEGLMVLHAYDRYVSLNSLGELRGLGFTVFDWYRYREAR